MTMDNHMLQDESSPSERLERLMREQQALFNETISKNRDLSSKVSELELELSVWKQAVTGYEEEKKVLLRKASSHQRSGVTFQDTALFVLCLIDGDGCIFSQDYLRIGNAGGRQAASLLKSKVTEKMNTELGGQSAASRAQISAYIYLNKKGLQDTLTANDVCTESQFDAFVIGFNQSNPLFSIVDVGPGKEGVDAKMREQLRVFSRFPQTAKIFFGVGPDNGYYSALTSLENEALSDKIIILQSHKHVASELRSLGLPSLEVSELFMPQKSTVSNGKRAMGTPSTPKLPRVPTPQSGGGTYVPPNARAQFSASSSSAPSQPRVLDPDKPLTKQRPAPCNHFYLKTCKHGDKCHFAHDYVLSTEQIDSLRMSARSSPCRFANQDITCRDPTCVLGHSCPRGPSCSFLKEGRCKFTGKDMHLPGQDRENRRPQNYSSNTFSDNVPESSSVNGDSADAWGVSGEAWDGDYDD